MCVIYILCPRTHNRVRASSLFKDMKTASMFWLSIDFHARTKSRVAFWLDQWCSSIPLVAMFPKIYDLALDEEATIQNYRHRQRWKLALRRGSG